MTQTSEITAQSTQDLWTTYEGLLADYEMATKETEARYAAYREACTCERGAWDASQVAYAAYLTAVHGGRE